MKRVLFAILLISAALAACVDNGICAFNEEAACADCSFTSVCVDDGECTAEEQLAGCGDCAPAPPYQCVQDNVCTDEERENGCPDCGKLHLSTGMLILVGGIGLFSMFALGVIVIMFVAIYYFGFAKRRESALPPIEPRMPTSEPQPEEPARYEPRQPTLPVP